MKVVINKTLDTLCFILMHCRPTIKIECICNSMNLLNMVSAPTISTAHYTLVIIHTIILQCITFSENNTSLMAIQISQTSSAFAPLGLLSKNYWFPPLNITKISE